jgi:hypothetical protein
VPLPVVKLRIVSRRLEEFIPQLEAANSLLTDETFNVEDVCEDETYIEMVSSFKGLL